MDAIGIASSGLRASYARFSTSAAAIASPRRSGADPGMASAPQRQAQGPQSTAMPRVETPGRAIMDDQIAMLSARSDVLANLAVVRTARDMEKSTLELWG
jgi:flagellar basal body rod protein FlgC